jgi:hypothetical protein
MALNTRLAGLAGGLLIVAATAAGSDVLTNEGVVVLAQAGYNERFVLDVIRTKPARFDTSVEGLVYLARHGVSENIVRTILGVPAEAQPAPARYIAPPRTPAPVRLRVTRQKVLVTEDGKPVGPEMAVVVEQRALGDRYYAIPPAGPVRRAEAAAVTAAEGPSIVLAHHQ